MKRLTMESDSLMVHDLAEGDISAFNSLFEKYSNRLYRFAWGYLKSDSEAEELVQDVFLVIWERRGKLDEKLSFKSFIFTIAFNNIKKRFRDKALFLKYVKSIELQDADLNTTNQVLYNSLKRLVNDLAKELPEHRRKIFIRSRLEGHSIDEIATEFNISHKTVENQLYHALKFMRDRLSKESLGNTPVYLLLLIKSLF